MAPGAFVRISVLSICACSQALFVGCRPLKRYIESQLTTGLSRLILSGVLRLLSVLRVWLRTYVFLLVIAGELPDNSKVVIDAGEGGSADFKYIVTHKGRSRAGSLSSGASHSADSDDDDM